jgi:LPS sulfotransferase NodH
VLDLQDSVPGISKRFLDAAYRLQNPIEFLDEVEALTANTNLVGFKLWISQDRYFILLRRLVTERGTKVLLLLRQNLLAKFSSAKLAKKTGQGRVTGEEEIIRETVFFDSDEFAEYLRRMTRQYERAKQQLNKLGCDWFELEYEQLTSLTVKGRLAEFLGVPDAPLVSPHRKRNTSRIIERFSNTDDVLRFLQSYDLSSWEKEN